MTGVQTCALPIWGMGSTISSHASNKRNEVGAPGAGKGKDDSGKEIRVALADRIETNLSSLLNRAEIILRDNREKVLTLAHALETHKTLTGDDVVAVLTTQAGPLVDGRPYQNAENIMTIEKYHVSAVTAHKEHKKPDISLPILK